MFSVVTPDLKKSLIKVLGLLKDAAESFSKVTEPSITLLASFNNSTRYLLCVFVRLQDSCVRQASRCIRTAKLVALQLHFLNQGSDLRVINLQPAEMLKTVTELPRCYQVCSSNTRTPHSARICASPQSS